MFVSIIGTPASGKTTFFKALSGAKVNGNGNGHPSVRIEVPDERIDALTKIFNPRKTTYSRLDVTDTVAIREGEVKNETLDAKSLQQIRQSDAVLTVLRHFDNGHAADPFGDFQRVQEEFILADMVQTEGRLERLRKQNALKPQPALQQEQALLEQCLAHLETGCPLSALTLSCEDDKKIRGFLYLSRKPMMIVVNCVEARLAEAETIASQLREQLRHTSPWWPPAGSWRRSWPLWPPRSRAPSWPNTASPSRFAAGSSGSPTTRWGSSPSSP